MGRFDAHDHLVRQGWKGKGTGESAFFSYHAVPNL